MKISLLLIACLPALASATEVRSPARIRAESALQRAYSTNEQAQFERAASLLEEVAHQEPDLALHKSLGYLYLDKLKQPAAAYPHLEAVTRQDPQPDWLLMLARASRETGRRKEAVALYHQVGKLTPNDPWARLELAKILRELKRPADARAVLREALEIDPKNNYVRAELAAVDLELGRYGEARELVTEIKTQEPSSGNVHVLAGDVLRKSWDLTGGEAEYRSALEINPTDVAARSGLQKIAEARAPQIGVTYYQFEDSDQLRQRAVYTTAKVPFAGRFAAVLGANFLDFDREAFGSAGRTEFAAGVLAHVDARLTLFAGVTAFETENLDSELGVDVAAYFSPTPRVDLSAGFSSAKPVNDSIQAVLSGLTQNVTSGTATWRVWSKVVVSGRGSYAEYADGNQRRQGVVAAGWRTPWSWFQRAALEYETVAFSRQTGAYSSPEHDQILRPVVQLAPRITDWLTVELRGELPYLFNEEEWGTGVSAGLRAQFSNGLKLGGTWLKYEIPGGQTMWSGEGFKVEASYRF
ncbi:MAG TPA: tetratricopeptide repeat protein [Chthoniobacterales bacterium]|jgi:tetratricopeptide (TPR) repeat protein